MRALLFRGAASGGRGLPLQSNAIWLGDSLGEMPLYYAWQHQA
jgi:3-deoxy-D-manno-octulosonic-acid transferase